MSQRLLAQECLLGLPQEGPDVGSDLLVPLCLPLHVVPATRISDEHRVRDGLVQRSIGDSHRFPRKRDPQDVTPVSASCEISSSGMTVILSSRAYF